MSWQVYVIIFLIVNIGLLFWLLLKKHRDHDRPVSMILNLKKEIVDSRASEMLFNLIINNDELAYFYIKEVDEHHNAWISHIIGVKGWDYERCSLYGIIIRQQYPMLKGEKDDFSANDYQMVTESLVSIMIENTIKILNKYYYERRSKNDK